MAHLKSYTTSSRPLSSQMWPNPANIGATEAGAPNPEIRIVLSRFQRHENRSGPMERLFDKKASESRILLHRPEAVTTQLKSHYPSGDVFSFYFWVAMFFLLLTNVITFTINAIILMNDEYMLATSQIQAKAQHADSLVIFDDGRILVEQAENLRLKMNQVKSFELIQGAHRGSQDRSPLNRPRTRSERGRFRINSDGVILNNVPRFLVLDRTTGKLVLRRENSKNVSVPFRAGNTFRREQYEVRGVRSPWHRDLSFQADREFLMGGVEGVTIDSRTFEAKSSDQIVLTSESLILNGNLRIDPRALPIVRQDYPGSVAQLKLCICLPSGMVYAVRAKNISSASAFADCRSLRPCPEDSQ